MNDPARTHAIEALRETLTEMLGEGAVLAGAADREFYSTDIYGSRCIAALVIRPESPESLARAVAAVTGAGFAVIGRGGGVSYTAGSEGATHPGRRDAIPKEMADSLRTRNWRNSGVPWMRCPTMRPVM